jgi:hypothetical protein
LAPAFIQAIPGSDGQEIFVSVNEVNVAGSPIFLNMDPGTGPAGHKGSYALTLSDTSYIATAIGFAAGMDIGNDGDDSMEITTTTQSGVTSTGKINFQRAFVEPSQPESVIVDNGNFVVDMPNQNTFMTDVYLLAMSTNAPPAALPAGHQFAGKAYQVKPSGSLTQSERFMTLRLAYQEPLPNQADPHTLAIVYWPASGHQGSYLLGDLFDDAGHLTYPTKRFGIYALATTPAWRDTFRTESGVAAFNNTESDGADIVLTTGATSGAATTNLITPTGAITAWGTLSISRSAPSAAGLTVDVLDADDNIVVAGASDGADLSSLSPASYPALKLRATLTRTFPFSATPALHEWSLSWLPGTEEAPYVVFLPMVVK